MGEKQNRERYENCVQILMKPKISNCFCKFFMISDYNFDENIKF